MVMKKRLIVVLVLLTNAPWTVGARGANEPVDFRGMKWGISPEEADRLILEQWDKRRQAGELILSTDRNVRHLDDRSKQLGYRDKIGTVFARIELQFLDDKFLGVILSFEPEHFNQIDSAFKARYGKPSLEDKVPLKNSFGATYINQRRVWQFSDVTITLGKYIDARTAGGRIAKRALDRYDEAQSKRKKDEAAKGL